MKKTILRTLLAASLLAAAPAFPAIDDTVAKPAPYLPIDAIQSAAKELQAAGPPKMNLVKRLDLLTTFRYTLETTHKLLDAFHSEHPYEVVRTPAPKGQVGYRATLLPVRHTSGDGTNTEWSALDAALTLDTAGRTLSMHASWPHLSVEDKQARFTVRDMTLTGKQWRGRDDLWFGNAQLDVGSVGLTGHGAEVAVDGLRFTNRTVEHPKTIDQHFGMTIKAITVAGERIEDYKLAMRVTNLDRKAMVELAEAGDQRPVPAMLTPEQRLSAMQPLFKMFGKASIARGTALEIDELSARYHGHTASIKGRVGLAGATEADVESIPALIRKIVARFEVTVPVAIVRDIASSVTRKQMAQQQPGQPVTEQAVAQMSGTIADLMIGKMISGGYARIENDVLRSTIEFRDGVLRVNGKTLELPASKPAPEQAGAGFVPERLLPGSCSVPDYPKDLAAAGQPQWLSMRFVIGADGRVREPTLTHASPSESFNQAVLAAVARCRYTPAMRAGKPVETPMTWNVMPPAPAAQP